MNQIEFIEKCYDRMDSYYSNFEEKNKQLYNNIKGLDDSISSYKSQVEELKNKAEKIKSELNNDIKGLGDTISSHKSQVEELKNEAEKIKSEKNILQSEIDKLKTQLVNHNNKSKWMIHISFAAYTLILLVSGIWKSDQIHLCIAGLIVLLIWAILICLLYRTPKNSDDF